MCHASTRPLHVICFTRPSLALVLQVTNAGVKRPGYEANEAGLESILQSLNVVPTSPAVM